jgi:hypothetical protein
VGNIGKEEPGTIEIVPIEDPWPQQTPQPEPVEPEEVPA